MKTIKIDIKDLPERTWNRTPFLTHCRKLIKDGEDPETRLEMYRGEVMCLAGVIGHCSQFTVKEDPYTRFVRYRDPLPTLNRPRSGDIPLQDKKLNTQTREMAK